MTNYPGNVNPGGYPPGGGRPGASFDLRSIMPGGLLVLAGGLLYFVFSFFPWYTVDFCGDFNVPNAYGFSCSVSANAWDRGVATFSVIVFLLVALAFLVKALRVVPPRVPLELIALGLVVLGDIFFLISFFNTQGTSRGWGLWVALVLWILINVGAVLEVLKARGTGAAQHPPGLQQGPPAGYRQQPPPPGGYQAPPPPPGQGGYPPPGQGGYPPQQPR
ncbi:MAG TPA: hypothetical protein VH496_00065 [Mycobacterium sp.]